MGVCRPERWEGMKIKLFTLEQHINKSDAIWPFGSARFGIIASQNGKRVSIPFDDESEFAGKISLTGELLQEALK
jgi:hypothetical protein